MEAVKELLQLIAQLVLVRVRARARVRVRVRVRVGVRVGVRVRARVRPRIRVRVRVGAGFRVMVRVGVRVVSRSSTCLTLSDCRVHAPCVCSWDLDSKRMSAISPSKSVFEALQIAETATACGAGLARGRFWLQCHGMCGRRGIQGLAYPSGPYRQAGYDPKRQRYWRC